MQTTTPTRAAEILATWNDDLPFATRSAVAWVLRCEEIEHDDALCDEIAGMIAERDAVVAS